MDENLKETMKENVLKVCEEYAIKNIDVNIDFAYALIKAVVVSTPNKIDDGIYAYFEDTKNFVKEFLSKQADKISADENEEL